VFYLNIKRGFYMRVWIVNLFDPLPNEGDRDGRYRSIAKHLYSQGHEVHWWSSNFYHGSKKHRDKNQVSDYCKIHLISTIPYRKNISIKRVINHVKFANKWYKEAKAYLNTNKAPDVLLASVPPVHLMHKIIAFKYISGCKVVFDIQDAWPEAFYRYIPVAGCFRQKIGGYIFSPLLRLRNKCLRLADACISVAEGYINLASIAYMKKPSLVVPIGISLSTRDNIVSKHNNREEEEKVSFVYIGNLADSYDLKTLIFASKKLYDEGYKFTVTLAGRGVHEQKLVKMVSKLGSSDYIRFVGYLTFAEVVNLLERSSVGLNCLFPDSYGFIQNKVSDYLAAGLPVINSVEGELANLIVKNNAGVQYVAGNVDSLFSAMKKYIDNPCLIKHQSICARRLCEQNFNRDVTYPIMVSFIENVVQNL